jgi:hypothetical protein
MDEFKKKNFPSLPNEPLIANLQVSGDVSAAGTNNSRKNRRRIEKEEYLINRRVPRKMAEYVV